MANSELIRVLDNLTKLLTRGWSSCDARLRSQKGLSTTALSCLLRWVTCYPARGISLLFVQPRTDALASQAHAFELVNGSSAGASGFHWRSDNSCRSHKRRDCLLTGQNCFDFWWDCWQNVVCACHMGTNLVHFHRLFRGTNCIPCDNNRIPDKTKGTPGDTNCILCDTNCIQGDTKCIPCDTNRIQGATKRIMPFTNRIPCGIKRSLWNLKRSLWNLKRGLSDLKRTLALAGAVCIRTICFSRTCRRRHHAFD